MHDRDSPAPWVRDGSLTPEHRERLLGTGVDPDVLAGLELRSVASPLPAWWHHQGNALYLHDGIEPPRLLIEHLTTYPFSDALIVLASSLETMRALMVGGDDTLIFIGPHSWFVKCEMYCGPGSQIVLDGHVVATGQATVDARNGGAVVAGYGQLWAAHSYIATDDMHRVEDVDTGARINPYGATIRLGKHVWLGRDAIVTGHVEIGDGAIVGMRSLVRGQKVPARTAVAGTPARVVRENVTWRGEDTP